MKNIIGFLTLSIIFGTLLIFAPGVSAQTATAGQLIISEFRYRGPNGANDEFIEIYNASGADHTVVAAAGGGYGIAASDWVTRCTIPNGTVIPNRGHYLCVNSVGYSLASYPSGNGINATGNATYTADIPDNIGIAIFNNNAGGSSYSLANRLDAVGTTVDNNALFREGAGLPSLVPFSVDYAFVRDHCGKGGTITKLAACPANGLKDSNNNAADFYVVDTKGTSAGAGQRLGSPGPENLSSPVAPSKLSQNFKIAPVDPCPSANLPPNRSRDLTSEPANNSTYGTIDFRFKVTNNSGANATRLRFRIVDLSTFPAPTGIADLRPRSSSDIQSTVDEQPCGSSAPVTVKGTTLEQPPSQPNGGGYNSTMSVGSVTPAAPLANGASVDVHLLFGIQQVGNFKVGIYIESLPSGGAFYYVTGNTENRQRGMDTPVDFDGDGKTDISIFRPSNRQWWHTDSFNGQVHSKTFGLSTDIPMAGDYTGDGVADRVVYRPSTGQWYVMKSENSTFYAVTFGLATDTPVVGDFDGDGESDPAVFRPSNGNWYILNSSTGNMSVVDWGISTDMPVPADFDGDNVTDVAIWRPSLGQWWIKYSDGGTQAVTFGSSSDKAVAGDYTGDGRADIAIWRPSTGSWYVLRSEDGSYYSFAFGVNGDVPSPGDYDGDGKFDACVFRPSTAQWFTWRSGSGSVQTQVFGLSSDVSLPNSLVP